MRTATLAVAACLVAGGVAGCGGGGTSSSATTAGSTRGAAASVATANTAPATTASASAQGGGVFGRIPGIVDSVSPSVVTVLASSQGQAAEGSGVIWRSNGLIVTNNHVIEGASRVQVAFATGSRVAARVKASDPLTDLALLQVDRNGLPAARFASALPEVGDLAVALGSPLGFDNSATAGIVSGLHRSIPSGGQTPSLVDLLQTDAPISPGNSGGALVNADSQVVGINVAFIPPQARAVSIGFAIPAPTVTQVVTQLAQNGSVRHAFIGVQPAELTPEIAQRFDLKVDQGAVVLGVESGTGAARAGLRPGDVIVSLDGKPIRSVEDLFARLREEAPGRQVPIEIVREGQRRRLTVTLSDRPNR